MHFCRPSPLISPFGSKAAEKRFLSQRWDFNFRTIFAINHGFDQNSQKRTLHRPDDRTVSPLWLTISVHSNQCSCEFVVCVDICVNLHTWVVLTLSMYMWPYRDLFFIIFMEQDRCTECIFMYASCNLLLSILALNMLHCGVKSNRILCDSISETDVIGLYM